MNISYYIIAIIISMVSTYYFYLLINCFVEPHDNRFYRVLDYFLLLFIVNVVIFPNDIVNIAYSMIGFILIMLLYYKGDIIKKVSVVVILYPIIVSLNFLASYANKRIYFLFAENYLAHNISHLITLCIITVVWAMIYKLSKHRIINAGKYVDRKTWVLIDIICLAPIISILIAIITGTDHNDFIIIPTAIASLITSIGIIFLIEFIINTVKTRLENQSLKLQHDYYRELEDNQLALRKLRHDMNNHLSVIGTFINNDNLDNAKEYFKSLSNKFTVHNRVFCTNSLVNAVINSKYNLAVASKIDCFFNIQIANILPIDDIDLCSIFANILDNAIEASNKIKEPSQRKITVKARVSKGYFTYSVTNNKSNIINISKKTYLSDKTNKTLHGFGLENVKDIVEKYNGTMNISYTDTEFSVIIIIKII